MNSLTNILPVNIDNWHRSREVQIIDTTNIFDYMDGGAELYLGYRFKNLEVLEYQSENSNNILVEIYQMENSDDAFGLLSLDWSGEPVIIRKQPDSLSTIAPVERALYGSGLLRLATSNYYIRVMAYRETSDVKNTVVHIGEILYQNYTPEPRIVEQLPDLTNIGWKMNPNKIAFFRSYMVLNSLFYLSHQNLLDLDQSVNAITVTYNAQSTDNKLKSIQLMILEYESNQKAMNALNHFIYEFLPDSNIVINSGESQFNESFKIEEGWLACKLENNIISLVFNVPDKNSAGEILDHVYLNNQNGE